MPKVRQAVLHTRDIGSAKRVRKQRKPHPNTQLGVSFLYALRGSYRRWGIRQNGQSNYSSSSNGAPKRCPEMVLEFNGKKYVLNDYNLAVLRKPRNVVDKKLLPKSQQANVMPPEGCSRLECQYYCNALDGKNWNERTAKHALPVALWVLENLQPKD